MCACNACDVLKLSDLSSFFLIWAEIVAALHFSFSESRVKEEGKRLTEGAVSSQSAEDDDKQAANTWRHSFFCFF